MHLSLTTGVGGGRGERTDNRNPKGQTGLVCERVPCRVSAEAHARNGPLHDLGLGSGKDIRGQEVDEEGDVPGGARCKLF